MSIFKLPQTVVVSSGAAAKKHIVQSIVANRESSGAIMLHDRTPRDFENQRLLRCVRIVRPVP